MRILHGDELGVGVIFDGIGRVVGDLSGADETENERLIEASLLYKNRIVPSKCPSALFLQCERIVKKSELLSKSRIYESLGKSPSPRPGEASFRFPLSSAPRGPSRPEPI